jgi:DNA-binding NtrC family response regulator
MSSFPVLIVEDKDSLRAMLRHALEAHGHAVVEARDETEAVQQLRQARPVVVLTDLKLPVGDGFGVLRAAKELDPELQVVVMTAYGSIQDAVTAMKMARWTSWPSPSIRSSPADGGAGDLAAPDPDGAILLKEELAERRGAPRIIGEDPKLRQVSQQLHRAAATDATVLLEGESDTGKEHFARALHVLSPRNDGPFVAINCAAIPETLLETELFGYEKGAFTGAAARKPGRFELAHRGTLFLDEIGDLPLALQAKILRALEEKQFERVGGTQSLHVDVRVVAATNRELKKRVAERQFREDLVKLRLSVFPIQIPPLREGRRRVDSRAPFLSKFCRDLNKKELTLAPAAIDELQAYPWPGNVRELQNCIERAVILTEGDTIHARHLGLSFRQAAQATPAVSPWEQIDLTGTMSDALRRVTEEVERRKITQALQDAGGNKAQVADSPHVTYKLLLQKMKAYGIAD